jgi:adenylylsulfate kinase
VSTPLEECERRDPKGLYRKARSGELAHFTGVSDPYEAPVTPDLAVNLGTENVRHATEQVLGVLRRRARRATA